MISFSAVVTTRREREIHHGEESGECSGRFLPDRREMRQGLNGSVMIYSTRASPFYSAFFFTLYFSVSVFCCCLLLCDTAADADDDESREDDTTDDWVRPLKLGKSAAAEPREEAKKFTLSRT